MVKFQTAGSAIWHLPTIHSEARDRSGALTFHIRDKSHCGWFGWPSKPFASISLSPTGFINALGAITNSITASQAQNTETLQLLPVGSKKGGKKQQYVWDGKRVKPINVDLLASGYTPAGRLQDLLHKLHDGIRDAFLPHPRDVTPDYWEWLKWRLTQRFFSSVMHNFATQSLLTAVGVGAKKAVAASAAINWMLKDGLGKIVRMTVATKFGQSFDSDLKRLRFVTSLLFTACISCEFLTPFYPQHFLLLASIANVGKAVGLTTFIATGPAFQQALCSANNLADITAKTQAQHMVVDTAALMLSASLTYLVRYNDRARLLLPLVMFPICAAGDLYGIWRELRSIQLRTLNRERSEMIADAWLATGRIPTMAEIASQESLLGPPNICGGVLPLRIVPLDQLVSSPEHLHTLLKRYGGHKYMLDYHAPEAAGSANSQQQLWPWRLPWQRPQPRASISVCLMDDVTPPEVLAAVLEAAHLRRALRSKAGKCAGSCSSDCGCSSGGEVVPELPAQQVQHALAESRRFAQRNAQQFMAKVTAAGWHTKRVLLSTNEKQGYVRMDA